MTDVHYGLVFHSVPPSCWILSAWAFSRAAISSVLIIVYKRGCLTLIWVECGSPGEQGPGTLPSCPLNGNQTADYIFKHNHVSYYYPTKSLDQRNSVYSPYPFTGIITPHPTPTPPPSPPRPLASWQEWRHCRWTNRFQLRSHSGCLIWGNSRCAPQILLFEYQDFLGESWRCNTFFL